MGPLRSEVVLAFECQIWIIPPNLLPARIPR
jgi:hypothetical protein